ncbi:MAG: OmpH family outer membrane protein [Bacteroidetes bacterium]|nr:OmpH family outer membrane protein [Bacteroidota bacterium]
MKKLIVAGVMAVSFLGATAQTKIGYINTQDLISVMPEALKADSQLQEYQVSLQKNGEDLQNDFDDKAAKFVKDSATLTETMKEVKRNELTKLYQRIQEYNQGLQDQINKKGQDLFNPIRLKAMDAIKAAAKKNGYTYVLDISAVLVGPPGDDILALVKKELGIKEAPAAPATKAPAKTGN